MRKNILVASLIFSFFTSLANETVKNNFPVIEKLKAETGKAELITEKDGSQSIKLQGITPEAQGSKYFSFSLFFKEPVNIENKQFSFTASTTTPDITAALYLRFYNEGSKKPSWSFFNWNYPFKNGETMINAGRSVSNKLIWEPKVTDEGRADKINRIQFYIGTAESKQEINMTIRNMHLAEAVTKRAIERTDKPSSVKHPAGLFRQEDIKRGQANIKHHDWAKEQLSSLRKVSDFWMKIPDNEISTWIPEDDAWFKCLCPNCFTQPEYAWKELLPDGKLKCENCKHVFPSEKFPENNSYTVTTPHGKIKTIKYYKGPDQMIHDENIGPRYHISGTINWVRLNNLNKIYALAYVYALTDEKPYAEKIRKLLLRFAEVYPDYMVKFRATVYESPENNCMAGKLCDWKFTDSVLIIALANAYDITYNSGLYSDEDKTKIENGIFRDFKWLITAFPPTKDWCLNAVPAHMTAGALSGIMLGDHDLIEWALKGEDGFKSFTEKYYHRDGFWYENSPAYASMANSPLYQLADVLSGYTDPADYKGPSRYENLNIAREIPRLKSIFSCMVPVIMPNGRLPAVNDSDFNSRLSLQWLDFNYNHSRTSQELAMLQYAAKFNQGGSSSVYAVFKRQDEKIKPELPKKITSSIIMTGPQWAVLRRPETAAESAALINYAGGNGGHFHNSTLNLVYYDYSTELATDLGYLAWQHPNRPWMISALAHNLVIVNGEPQDNKRNGKIDFWSAAGKIKAATMSAPSCYPGKTEKYQRTVLNIPLSDKHQYLADFFTVKGGDKHLYTFHADGDAFTAPQNLEFTSIAPEKIGNEQTGSRWLKNLQSSKSQSGLQHFTWRNAEGITTNLYWLNDGKQEIITAKAPGIRDRKNPFDKTMINLFMAQANGPENTFAGIISASKNKSLISEVKKLDTTGTGKTTAIRVKHAEGIDIIIVAENEKSVSGLKEYPQLNFTGQYAVIRLNNNKPVYLWMGNAETLKWEDIEMKGIPSVSGIIESIDTAAKKFHTDINELPANFNFKNNYLLINGGNHLEHHIEKAAMENGLAVFYTDDTELGNVKSGNSFSLPLSYEKEIKE